MTYETKEPEYIEESEDIMLLKKYYTPNLLGIQKGHWSLMFILLTQTLYIMYKNTNFSHLVNRSHIHEESNIFSLNLAKVVKINEWSRTTASIAFNSLKKLLCKTNINESFINKIILPSEKKIKQNSPVYCIPTKYKKMNDDDPIKITLIEIVKTIKLYTKYKSQKTIAIFLAFVLKFLEYHKIQILDYNNVSQIPFESIIESLKNICISIQLRRKVHYIMVFVCFVVKNTTYLDKFESCKKTIISVKKTQIDTDVHRIGKEELEKIYEESKKNIKHQTLFLIMISTGMRTIGVSNIKIENICSNINNVITINNTGKTIEKGNKWFTFSISEDLSKLLLQYITTKRKNISSYLFPGRGENIGISPGRISAIIKEMAKKIGLNGKHIHAHSIRHSFAHILIEMGNKPELVSKMLGHTSVQTTEQYYLKESAAEVSSRMDIPWLEKSKHQNPVPEFLNNYKPNKKSKRERNKILSILANDFKEHNNI